MKKKKKKKNFKENNDIILNKRFNKYNKKLPLLYFRKIFLSQGNLLEMPYSKNILNFKNYIKSLNKKVKNNLRINFKKEKKKEFYDRGFEKFNKKMFNIVNLPMKMGSKLKKKKNVNRLKKKIIKRSYSDKINFLIDLEKDNRNSTKNYRNNKKYFERKLDKESEILKKK